MKDLNIYLSTALTLIIAVVAGSIVNMAIVMIGPYMIAPPVGVDMSSVESMKEGVHLLESKHFLFPLIAHATGTYVGALTAYHFAQKFKAVMAMIIGVLFFLGGISAALTIPAPNDFILVDLLLAYFPMAYAAIKTLEPDPRMVELEERIEMREINKEDD
ncbi:MAG: hypothetical protein VW882_05760 [Gammaproteobacteria bacterium]